MWFPPKGGDVTDPSLGWFESNEGGFQKLGRLSRHSNHHLLTWLESPGLARIRSRGDVRGRSRADGFGCVTGMYGFVTRLQP
jgi:hypothetical protein